MWQKIKDFFSNKTVIIVESVIMALSCAGLIIGGVDAQEASKQIAFDVGAILMAIEALITFIQGITKKKSE